MIPGCGTYSRVATIRSAVFTRGNIVHHILYRQLTEPPAVVSEHFLLPGHFETYFPFLEGLRGTPSRCFLLTSAEKNRRRCEWKVAL